MTRGKFDMTNILQIDSSIFGKNGASSQLTQDLVNGLKAQLENTTVNYRSVSEDELPHFSAETIRAIGDGSAELADTLISEVQNADVIVVGVPMYNFGVPSQLKSWFDYIARAGVTFRYTSEGPEGLLKDKKVFVITTRGGLHKDKASDIEVPFLKTILGFVGLTDVDFIYAEGLSMSDHKENAMTKAQEEVKQAIANYLSKEE